jgi:hypothetical protein
MRILINAVVVSLAVSVLAGAQTPDPKIETLLKRLFPLRRASQRRRVRRRINVFGKPAGVDGETMIGLGFWTTELEPSNEGTTGRSRSSSAWICAGYWPAWWWSSTIDVREFLGRTAGVRRAVCRQSVRDPFKVGEDIDAISRASITNLVRPSDQE